MINPSLMITVVLCLLEFFSLWFFNIRLYISTDPSSIIWNTIADLYLVFSRFFFDLFMTIMLLMCRILSSLILLFDWLRNCLMDFFVVLFIDRHAYVLSLISTCNDALFRIAVAETASIRRSV